MTYNPAEKPDPHECPRRFCFMWHSPKSLFHSGVKQSAPATETSAMPGSDGQCYCTFGTCVRFNSQQGDHDWYEPHESNLKEARLPWFYFDPSPEKLAPMLRDKYIAESEALWGKRHWENHY